MAFPDPIQPPNSDPPGADEAAWDALSQPLEVRDAAPLESDYVPQDEDRLYTDEVIRQSETESRLLFFSFIFAALLIAALGIWYVFAQRQSPPEPEPVPLDPLPIPEQPLTPAVPGSVPQIEGPSDSLTESDIQVEEAVPEAGTPSPEGGGELTPPPPPPESPTP